MNAETFSNATDSESEDDADSGDIRSTVSLEHIWNGEYQVVYAHLEARLQTKQGKRVFLI